MLSASSFFDLSDFAHADLFTGGQFVWTALDRLKEYMDAYSYPNLDSLLLPEGVPLPAPVVLYAGQILDARGMEIHYGDTNKGGLRVIKDGEILAGAAVIMAGAVLLGRAIEIGNGVLVESGALIKSPAIIGEMSEVRQGAYLRGCCISGKRCILGHTTEIKHSIFLNDAKAGHFAYLGDSILGNNTNLGAGTKFANLRFLPGNIVIRAKGERFDTGRRKIGAILGDRTQTGCNSVTSPGTVFGKSCILMPNATAPSGFHPEGTMLT
jgi:carbonic anhydrase/acetyltransferase-like protein (isoleucine patch superfamily)